jgi:hypothetical protein
MDCRTIKRCPADRVGEVRSGPQPLGAPAVAHQVGEPLSQAARGDALDAVDQLRVEQERAASAGVQAVLVGPQPYGVRVQLRYPYRLTPTAGQRIALAKAFGCARVVFNDGIAARRAAREAGAPYPSDAVLSRALTAAKRTRSGHGWPRCRRWCCSRRSPREHRLPELLRLDEGHPEGPQAGSTPGSGPSGTGSSRSASPRQPGSGSPRRAGCDSRGSGTSRCAGRAPSR